MGTKNTKKQKSKGLGDTVEKVFKATGVDKVAKWVLGEDCGCDERKEFLNKLFPYVKPECLTEEEFEYLHWYFTESPSTITADQQKRLVAIYNRVLHQKAKTTRCTPCFMSNIHTKLYKIYKEYAKQYNE
jgi:hypothetical protein